MGATDKEKRDVDYCVAAALVQLEDLEPELREEAFLRLAHEAAQRADLRALAQKSDTARLEWLGEHADGRLEDVRGRMNNEGGSLREAIDHFRLAKE